MCERIRWALHSLCQATLEAVAVPLPRLRRLPRCPTPIPPPAPEPDPEPTCTSPPPSPALPPERLDPTTNSPASPAAPSPLAHDASPQQPSPLQTGVPPSSSWLRRDAFPTLWSSLQCGPNHVALAGYTTTLSPNLRIASLNTNGLTMPKLTELLFFFF